MTRRLLPLLLIASALAATACTSGDDSAKCEFSGQTTLADPSDAAWPKFARDIANTGHIEGVRVASDPAIRWVFPPPEDDALQPISSTALVGPDGAVRFIGVNTASGYADVTLYVLDSGTGAVLNNITPTPVAEPEASPTAGPPLIARGTSITGTPLLGADGTIYVPLNDGTLRRFEEDDGTALTAATIGGFISSSLNIATDGTVYVGSLGGTFSAVCPNGIPRFILSPGAIQSTPALIEGASVTDRLILLAGDDAQVRAVDYAGRRRWAFFASGAVRGSVVVDHREIEPGEPLEQCYVADEEGWVFAHRLTDGSSVWSRRPGGGAAISATPALGVSNLYVADEGGVLYALDPESGAILWSCNVGASIRSSPAVASTGSDEVVVFGADDATVYAVDATAAAVCAPPEGCGCDEVALWTIAVDAPVGRSAPSIDFAGTVYVGTQGGHLYAIGAPAEQPTATGTPTPTRTPQADASATPGTAE